MSVLPAVALRSLRPSQPGFAAVSAPVLERFEADLWGGFYEAAPSGVARGCGLSVASKGGASLMAASEIDILFFNRVVGLGLEAPVTEARLDEILAWYRAAGARRFFIQLSPAALPAAQYAWMAARGLRYHNSWVKLYRGVSVPAAPPTDLRIEEAGPEAAASFARIVIPAFGWPDAVQPWMVAHLQDPGWRCYLAYEGDAPVAAGAMYVRGEQAYFGPAGTHPDFRGRGAQGALIARRIRDAAAMGCRLLITETAVDRPGHASPSYRNMRRFGFDVAYFRPNYLFDGPGR